MQRISSIRAVLFDHDGTLVDSVGLVQAATNAVLAGVGIAAQDRASIGRSMTLATIPRMASYDGCRDDGENRRRAAAFYRESRRLAARHAQAYPGIRAMLHALRRFPLGVVSNNEGPVVRTILRAEGILPAFGLAWGEDDVPAPKPDPRGVIQAALVLGADPASCIYVGDSPVDLTVARAAGMRSVGVAWGTHPGEELAALGFDAIVASPLELADLLRSA